MNQSPKATASSYRLRAEALEIEHRAFIDGRYVDATTGERFASISPIDGAVAARVASCGALDVELAVAAARRSFSDGRWSRTTLAFRKAVMLRFADILENKKNLILLEWPEMVAEALPPAQVAISLKVNEDGTRTYNTEYA